MSRAAARQTSVLHSTPGRLRVRLSPQAARRHEEVEQEVRQVGGVTEVRASTLTGNVLVRFDARQVAPEAILAALAVAEARLAQETSLRLTVPSHALAIPGRGPAGALHVGGLLAAALVKRKGRPGPRRLGTVTDGVGLLAESPLLGRKVDELLGQGTSTLLASAASILAGLLSANPLRLAVAGAEAVLLLLAVLGRLRAPGRQDPLPSAAPAVVPRAA